MPALSAGIYYVVAKDQLGGSPAETDPSIGWGTIQWDGTVTLPISLVPEKTLTYNTSGAGTPSANSLYTVVQMMNFADTTTNSGKLTVFKPDGSTSFLTRNITVLSGAAAIVDIG